jgi:hypothetical protein
LGAPDVVKLAWPELFSATLASVRPPAVNVTVPVGVPDPGELAVTVAVKVTGWPCAEGFGEEVSDVVEESLFTVCVRALDVLPLKLLSPE